MAVTTVVAPDAPPDEGPPVSPHGRRWPRRLLIGLNVFVAVCLLAAAGVYGYVTYRFGQIGRISIPGIAPQEAAGLPLNILVVGSDSRSFVKSGTADAKSFGNAALTAGARSDTIMIVHLDPGAGTASLLSIPRDLWVPIADKGYNQRINTAFDVGPDLLVRTIQDDLGISINHYVEVDFESFRQVVDALGGVKFWYPEPVHDTFSGLNITTPGCYTLSGTMALSLVRARHMTYQENGRWRDEAESDLARIRRQQLFVKKVINKAEAQGFTNVTALNGVVGGIVNNITVDSGFSQKEMLRLAKRFKGFNPDGLVSMTLPATPTVIHAADGDADVLLPIPDQDKAVTDAFQGIAAPAQPAASAPAGPVTPVDPATINVKVLNGSGRTGEATSTTRDLRAAGFAASIDGTGRADNFDYATTIIKYSPADATKAAYLQSVITGGAVLQQDATATDLILITGSSYAGLHASGVVPTATTAPPASTATTGPASGAGGTTPATTAKPAFPGIHGTDPPPPGSGC